MDVWLSPLGLELVSVYLQQGSRVQSWAGTFIGLIYDYRTGACQATLPLLGKFVYLLCFSGDVKTSSNVMSYFRGHSDALVWSHNEKPPCSLDLGWFRVTVSRCSHMKRSLSVGKITGAVTVS